MISSKKYRYNIKNIDIISKKYLKIYVDILIFFRYRKKKYRYYIRYQLYIRYISDILDIYLRYIWYNIWYISDFLDIYLIFFGLKISNSLAIISKKYSNNINKISIFEKNIWYKSDINQNIRYISDIVKKNIDIISKYPPARRPQLPVFQKSRKSVKFYLWKVICFSFLIILSDWCVVRSRFFY